MQLKHKSPDSVEYSISNENQRRTLLITKIHIHVRDPGRPDVRNIFFFLTTDCGPLVDDAITLVGHKHNFCLLHIFV